jgi:hypothetical protein
MTASQALSNITLETLKVVVQTRRTLEVNCPLQRACPKKTLLAPS